MIPYEQIPLFQLSARRALESGKISLEKYQEIMNEIEKTIKAKRNRDDHYQKAIEKLTNKKTLVLSN